MQAAECPAPLEAFGTESQRALQRRAYDLWRLVSDDPRFFSHGRAVATFGDTDDTIPLQIALARLQGAGPADDVPLSQLEARCKALQDAGLQTDHFMTWYGGDAAFAAVRDVLIRRPIPPDLTLHRVDGDTPQSSMAALDARTQSCDVMLPMGPFIRGLARPATCVYVADTHGRPVAVSAAIVQHAQAHPSSDLAWWGMLATDPDRRGEGLALILGAQAMLDIVERQGVTRVRTGIRDGNVPSEALYRKLGLVRTDRADVIAIHPPAFATGQMTK